MVYNLYRNWTINFFFKIKFMFIIIHFKWIYYYVWGYKLVVITKKMKAIVVDEKVRKNPIICLL